MVAEKSSIGYNDYANTQWENHMITNKLSVQLSAGKIKRYHTHHIIGEQTVGEHTYGLVQILRHIMQDNCSKNVLCAALDHDVLEFYTGDIPYPAKEMFPTLKDELTGIENQLRTTLLGVLSLTYEEAVCLKAADMLEMASFGIQQAQMGNSFGLTIVKKVLADIKQLDSAVLPQVAKDLIVQMESEYVSQR